MSALLVPNHVRAGQIAAHKRKMADEQKVLAPVALPTFGGSGPLINEIDAPIPTGIPTPCQWRVTLTPVNQRTHSKSGLIEYPPEYLDVQNWTHLLWKVCKVGPFVYSGPAWQGHDPAKLQAARDELTIGSLWLVDAKAPRRYYRRNPTTGIKTLFIVVNDDQLWSKVEPGDVEGLEFPNGLEL